MDKKDLHKIIISRTDAIGDVVLTLPLAAQLKKILGPQIKVLFLGRAYTQPVVESCSSIDEFLDYDAIKNAGRAEQVHFFKSLQADAIIHVFPKKDIAFAARAAKIPLRIGTRNRLYHWLSCNCLIKLSRKNSEFHEALLNMKLLSPFSPGIPLTLKDIPSLYHFTSKRSLPKEIKEKLSRTKFRIVLHPKSHASAREWNLTNYSTLIEMLKKENFQIILTGGEAEKELLNAWTKNLTGDIVNLAGQLSLAELISLLDQTDGIVAASTGPLHVAAALGKHALGIYPPIRPMHPGRWAPVGYKAEYLVINRECSSCRNAPASCICINEISPEIVFKKILQWRKS